MKKHVLTFILVALLPIAMMAQSGSITEPGASEPTQLYTTTYDNPSGPNHAPGGPNRTGEVPSSWGGGGGSDAGYADKSPVGAPWVLLAFAAAYAGVRLVKRGKKGVEE